MKEPINPGLDLQRLIGNFNGAADSYTAVARLQKYVGEQLCERLDLIKITPEIIIDLGSGPGDLSRALAKRYPSAGIVQLDIAEQMLIRSRKNTRRFFSRQMYLCADAVRLPIKDKSTGFVFSNLMLQWSQDPDALFNELARVLRPNGLFMFSTLGPDTLRELRESWSAVDNDVHVNNFIDMHDLGDALVRAGFSDPVMEVEMVTSSYADIAGLMSDLKGLGARNVNRERRRTLTGKGRYRSMLTEYATRKHNGLLPATYEVIYGHAWAPDHHNPAAMADSTYTVSLEQFKHTLKTRTR